MRDPRGVAGVVIATLDTGPVADRFDHTGDFLTRDKRQGQPRKTAAEETDVPRADARAVDPDQRAYHAACTPDFFLYDSARRLAYCGAFDQSTPGNGKPVTGELLRAAIELTLADQPLPEPHRPSMGCSIKWRS